MSVTPTPRRLYIHDDLSELASAVGRSTIVRLTEALLAAVRREPHVAVLTLAEQIDGVLRQGGHPPFATTIGIGRAGERVARQLHARSGWFPSIVRVEITREEDGRGGYALAVPAPLSDQLEDVAAEGAVAVVDDTIFSGLTMRAVLEALPPPARGRVHVFCLRAVEESLRPFAATWHVTAGFAAAGRLLDDVSFINASGLVRRGAIRRAGETPLAFFEREEWMRAWFPGDVEAITGLCARLCALFEAALPASLAEAPAVSSPPP